MKYLKLLTILLLALNSVISFGYSKRLHISGRVPTRTMLTTHGPNLALVTNSNLPIMVKIKGASHKVQFVSNGQPLYLPSELFENEEATTVQLLAP